MNWAAKGMAFFLDGDSMIPACRDDRASFEFGLIPAECRYVCWISVPRLAMVGAEHWCLEVCCVI